MATLLNFNDIVFWKVVLTENNKVNSYTEQQTLTFYDLPFNNVSYLNVISRKVQSLLDNGDIIHATLFVAHFHLIKNV